jgi:hypothetical protein
LWSAFVVLRNTTAAQIPGRITLQFPVADFSGVDDAPRWQNDLHNFCGRKSVPPVMSITARRPLRVYFRCMDRRIGRARGKNRSNPVW